MLPQSLAKRSKSQRKKAMMSGRLSNILQACADIVFAHVCVLQVNGMLHRVDVYSLMH